MENLTEHSESEPENRLIVTEEMRSYFYEMAKWASFLAVIGFIGTGLIVLSAFMIAASAFTVGASDAGATPEIVAMFGQLGVFGRILLTVIMLVFAFAAFYPSLLLFKYATKAKYGVLYGDQESVNEAFGKLKSLFKYWGIITIIYIGLYLIVFVSKITTGFAGA